jgi:2-polyprenyl-6-methoxyphenol hydroxylase and related FAD-dependent oxidoreductases
MTIKDEFLSEFIIDDSLNNQNIVGLFKNYSKKLSLKSLVGQYSMKTSRAKSLLRNNVILFGNSSHLIHTIGAQGYNFGVEKY